MPKQHSNYELVSPSASENKHLSRLKDDAYTKVSEMSLGERQFLNCLIRRYKPKKLLELGVSAGGSSVVMLQAISDDPAAKLHSIDYSTPYYLDPSKNSGFVVDNYPKLKDQWKLYTGGLPIRFLDEIGEGVDFCLIDTMHILPGEVLDTLMVLPYLKDNAIIVYHDVGLHTLQVKSKFDYDIRNNLTNGLLLSTVPGKKYLQGDFDFNKRNSTHLPNIGAIQLDVSSKQHAFELFNLLGLLWVYLPSTDEEEETLEFMARYYDEYLVEMLKRLYDFQRKISVGEHLMASGLAMTRMVARRSLSPVLAKSIKRLKDKTRRAR